MDVARLFALDHNFPQPIVEVLQEYQADASFVRVDQIDERLPRFEDWELLLALHHHELPWEGLITTDDSMLNLPRELAVIMQTQLTLVVAAGAGHDPVKATGLMFAQIGGICARTSRDKPQIWHLKTTSRDAKDPWGYFQRAAEHRSVSSTELKQSVWLTDEELASDPLN